MTSQEQFVCCCEALLIAGEALHDQIQDSGRGPVRRALATIPALQGHPESTLQRLLEEKRPATILD
jgi:hypothetical protein